MAIVLNNTPAAYSSAHGDLVYTAYESVKSIDPTTYPNYKYICDVYVNGVMVVRLKSFPNPVNHRGVFNIGLIVRNYVSATFNPAVNAIQAQQLSTYAAAVQCKFGEEYSGIEYTNLTIDSSRNVYNHYNDRLLGGYSILGNYANKVASNRSLITSVKYTSDYVFVPYFPTSTSGIAVLIKSYDSGNSLLASNTITVTPSAAYYMQTLNLSPSAINTSVGGAVPSNTSYYTATISSIIYRFNIYCEPRYSPLTIHFLNQLGGFDSFEFPKVNKKGIDITSKTYTQLGYSIDSSGVMSYYNGKVLADNQTTFYGMSKERKILNTDFISEGAYSWLGELVRSPQLYIESGGYFIPVVITDTAYEFKTLAVDRQFNLAINISFGDSLNVQFR
jgi:hypothetical protein